MRHRFLGVPTRSVLLLVLAMVALPVGGAIAGDEVLTDFDEQDVESRWATVNDNVMGGRSTGGPAFSDGVLVFSGSTNTNGGGFSSLRMRESALDFSDADGFVVRVRGDGRTYMLDLRTRESFGRRRVAYRAEFETKDDGTWQEVRIPFDEFTPTVWGQNVRGRVRELDLSGVRSVGFMIYDGEDGPFEIQIDWLKTYTESPDEPALPEAWHGVWEGEATSALRDGSEITFRTRLEIEPVDDGRWTWTLTYGEGDREQVRPYELLAMGGDEGHFRIDEKNGIVLEQRLVGNGLYGRFVVGQSDITTSYVLDADGGTMTMELVTYAAPATGETSGGEDGVPTVFASRPIGVQRAVLECP